MSPFYLGRRLILFAGHKKYPVRLQHRRLEIVEHDTPGNAAKVPERILQAHQERIGRLP
jgi:hypothetical protein